jgi:hypothetical protein
MPIVAMCTGHCVMITGQMEGQQGSFLFRLHFEGLMTTVFTQTALEGQHELSWRLEGAGEQLVGPSGPAAIAARKPRTMMMMTMSLITTITINSRLYYIRY